MAEAAKPASPGGESERERARARPAKKPPSGSSAAVISVRAEARKSRAVSSSQGD